MTYVPGLWKFLLASCILSVLIVLTWKHRTKKAGRSLLALMALALVWTAGFSFELAATTFRLKLLFCRIQFFAIPLIPVAWYRLVRAYAGRPVSRRLLAALLVIPAATIVLAWLVPLPNPFWSAVTLVSGRAPFPILDYGYGPWFYWVHSGSCWVFLLMTVVALAGAYRKLHPGYRPQLLLLLLSLLIPTVSDVLYVVGFTGSAHINATPAIFSVSCILLAWTLYRYRFIDLLPVARDLIIETMENGILVVDVENRIVDLNPRAAELFSDPSPVLGMDIGKLEGGRFRDIISEMDRGGETKKDVLLGESGCTYDLRLSPVRNGAGERAGLVITLHDITERVRLYEQVWEFAVKDELTGLFNRRFLIEMGNRELERAARNPDYRWSLLLLDLDNFKAINDTCGHSAGDRVLRELAEKGLGCIRRNDVFCRFGGDEFALVMPDTELEEALVVAKRLHEGIGGIRIEELGDDTRIEVSSGVVSSDVPGHHGGSLDRLFGSVDELMYEAKRNGGNRIVSPLGVIVVPGLTPLPS